MITRCPATFTHPDWIRAISAHLPGMTEARVPVSGALRIHAALQLRHWPVRHYETWLTPLTNSGLPASGTAPSLQDVQALLDATQTPIILRNLPLLHPVTEMMLQSPGHQHILSQWQRAVLDVQSNFETWLQDNFDQKRRKELKRLRARLSEQGTLIARSLKPDDDLAPFMFSFLHLEAESWKGDRGTAIANNPSAVKALQSGLEAMHAKGRLKFWTLTLDETPVAALFALVDDGEVSLGKIAHANAFSKYSPGVLVILDATAEILDDPHLVRADSNAMPDHPMINRIWRDRMDCVDLALAGPSTPSAVFRILTFWLGMKHAAKTTIKRVLAQTTGRKTS